MIISFFVVIKEKSPHDRGNGLSYPRGSRGFPPPQEALVIKITDQVLTWSVRILLLLLGLALGADDRLMSQMDTIGARGIFISLCCVAGSLIGARLLEPIMNRHVGRYAVSRTAKDEGAAQ